MTVSPHIEYERGTEAPRAITGKTILPGVTEPVYLVGEQRVHNRLDSIDAARAAGREWPDFRVWDHPITMSEPGETFTELCQRQARRIRAQHSRIRLWYSGGMDSHTVLRAFLEQGLDVEELCVWRRFPGFVDGVTNIELDYLGTLEALREYRDRHHSRARIRVFDIMPHHFRWYSDNFAHYIRHRGNGLNEVMCTMMHPVLECYPGLVDADTLNLTGAGGIVLEPDGFRFHDSDFNSMLTTPNTMFFYADQGVPELQFKYAYALRQHRQDSPPGLHPRQRLNQAKRSMGFSALLPQLETKFCGGLRKELPTHTWGRKEALLVTNAVATTSGRRMLVRYRQWFKQLQKSHRKYLNDGLCTHGWIGALSEKHHFRED